MTIYLAFNNQYQHLKYLHIHFIVVTLRLYPPYSLLITQNSTRTLLSITYFPLLIQKQQQPTTTQQTTVHHTQPQQSQMLIPLPLTFSTDNITLLNSPTAHFESTASIPTILINPAVILQFDIPIIEPIYLKISQPDNEVIVSDMKSYVIPIQVYPEPQLELSEITCTPELLSFIQFHEKHCIDSASFTLQLFTIAPASLLLEPKSYKSLVSYHNSMTKNFHSEYICPNQLKLQPHNYTSSLSNISIINTHYNKILQHQILVKYNQVPLYFPPTGLNLETILFLNYMGINIPLSIQSVGFNLPNQQNLSILPGSSFLLFPWSHNLTTVELQTHEPLINKTSLLDPPPELTQSFNKNTHHSQHKQQSTKNSTTLLSSPPQNSLPAFVNLRAFVISSLTPRTASTTSTLSTIPTLRHTHVSIVGPKSSGKSTTLYHSLSALSQQLQLTHPHAPPPLYVKLPISDLFDALHPTSTQLGYSAQSPLSDSLQQSTSSAINSLFSIWLTTIWDVVVNSFQSYKSPNLPQLFIHFDGLDALLRDDAHNQHGQNSSTLLQQSSDNDQGIEQQTSSLNNSSAGLITQISRFISSCPTIFSQFGPTIILESNLQILPTDTPTLSSTTTTMTKHLAVSNSSPIIIPTKLLVDQPQTYCLFTTFPNQVESSLVLLALSPNIFSSTNHNLIKPYSLYSSFVPQLENKIVLSQPSQQERFLHQLLTLRHSSGTNNTKFARLLMKYQHSLPVWLNCIMLPTNTMPVLEHFFTFAFLQLLSNLGQQRHPQTNLDHKIPPIDSSNNQYDDWLENFFNILTYVLNNHPGLLSTVAEFASQHSTESFTRLINTICTASSTLALSQLVPSYNSSNITPSSTKSLFSQLNPTQHHNQFVGSQHIVNEFNQVIRQWQLLLNLGASSTINVGGNILLHGPHGNGKSLLIETMLSHGLSNGKINIIRLNPSDVYSKYLGDSEKKIRQTFATARQLSPCVVVIDNIDSIASNRETRGENHNAGVDLRILSTLLNELDGLDSQQAGKLIFVIATCADLNDIDPALLRSGRFDHTVRVSSPQHHDICLLLNHELNIILTQAQLFILNHFISKLVDTLTNLNLSSGTIIQLVRQVISSIVISSAKSCD